MDFRRTLEAAAAALAAEGIRFALIGVREYFVLFDREAELDALLGRLGRA